MTTQFPQDMDFGGWNAPSRIEADIYDLVVEGTIPEEINGNWYRTTPDPQYPPRPGTDTYLSGDGMISYFHFENGHVDFKSRYILTERLKNDRAARRSLYGIYRNPYTDDPSVQGKARGTANTTPVFHGGKLLCLKEDSRPMEVHPHTLETIGEWDFDGKLRSETMTAHPRYDHDTGEMYWFGYEAGGLATDDVAFCVADKDGNLIREDWFKVPYTAMMHDFLITKEHVIFPVFPTTTNLERIKAGGPHWVYEQDLESYVGIMRRDGSVKDMRWFKGPNCMAFHFMNAFTDGEYVHMDFGVSDVNGFPFILEASGIQVDPATIKSHYTRWTFDMTKPGEDFEQNELAPPGDMPRIAEKDHMRDYDIGYYLRFDPSMGPPNFAGPVGPGMNTISRLEIKTGKLKNYMPNNTTTVEEPIHVPSKKPGHEGYLIYVADLHDQGLSDVIILEAEHVDNGPIATIKMPYRLRTQVHGNWVSAENLR
ncbi:MAG: carotenoid oxygenase family protein [Halioglobus sp.]